MNNTDILNYSQLLNIYTNAEAAKILNLSRERIRQIRNEIRTQVETKSSEEIHEERNFEELRNQYLEDMSSGKASQHSKRIKEFAEENCLPWPPSSIRPPEYIKMNNILKDRLVLDHKIGMSINALAEKYNIHPVYVYKIIRVKKNVI